jgi:hypothetical protein
MKSGDNNTGINNMKIYKTALGKILTTALFASLSLNVACAPVSKISASNTGNALTQAYVWYDGEREQKIWLNPQLVADFSLGAEKQNALQAGNVAATPLQTKQSQPNMRLWKLGSVSASAASDAIQSLQSRQPAGKYSPVFHDGSGSAASMRALPGNIIVYLNPAWDATLVDAWVKKRKLEIVKKLDIGPNIYVIKTGPGLEALDTANTLYKSGEVNAAFPDWWQGVEAK